MHVPSDHNTLLPGARQTLPPEVVRFFASAFPQTLTLRGPPGAGKTTFALEVLDHFEGFRGYVTSRVTKAAISRDHPWIERSGARSIEIVEFLRFRTGSDPTGLRVGRLRDALQARASDLVDLSTVLSLPDELAQALTSGSRDPKLVVVDSWEAWIENTLGPTPFALDVPTTRWELERSMLDLFREAGAHVLLVVEREDRARLDYVTDGALELTVSAVDGRTERWLAFQKLRGVRVGSATYPFTLDGGRFQSFPPVSPEEWTGPIPDQPDPGPGIEGLWPGSLAWAIRFGRLPIPGATLLEADGETPGRLLGRVLVPVIASAIRSGGHVVVRPPAHVTPHDIWRALAQQRRETELVAGLRILSSEPAGTFPEVPEEVVLRSKAEVPLDAARVMDELESAGFFRGSLPEHSRSLVVLSTDPPLGTTGGAEALLTLASLVRQAGDPVATILVTRAGDPFIESFRARSSLHVLLHASRGQSFLTGIRPWTPHFVLTRSVAADSATTPFDLVPIV